MAIEWLNGAGYAYAALYTDDAIMKELQEHQTELNYLTIEYIVNVKHEDNDTTKGA